MNITEKRHDYALEVFVENTGSTRIEQYAFDLSFPDTFLNQSMIYALEVSERRTTTHRHFRATKQHYPNQTIFPGDMKRVFVLDYFLDDGLFWDNTEMARTFKATLRCGDEEPIVQEHRIRDFQNF